MLAKRIIPCLDVKDGKVVKGTNFVGLIDAGSVVELSRRYELEGADELVFLDITASVEKRGSVYDVVEKTAGEVFMPLTVGGGIKSIEDMKKMLGCGADKVSLNTAAVNDPDLISQGAKSFGNQCIVLAIDAKKTGSNKWQVFTNGGRTPTGLDVVEWAKRATSLGAGEILLTSMDADGTRDGYDVELTRAVADVVDVAVIASGGAGKLEDFYQVLSEGRADAVLAASVFHFGQFKIADVKNYLKEKGLEVRL